MCGSKGSAPTPSSASTTTAGSSTGSAVTNFAQGPTPATGQRYEDFLNKVTSLAQTPFDPSTLSSVAPLNDFQNQGLSQMFNLGMTMGDFQPEKIQEIMSPYIQNVVNTSQDWFNNQNKIQGNNLISQGIRSGNAFGGDRAGIAEAELAGQQQLAQAPVIAGLYQSGYGQALNEYNTLKQFGLQGAEEAVKAGTVQQAQSQRELDIATQNALQRSGYPFQVANWEGAALGGIGPLTGTVGQSTTASSANTTGISNPPTPNPLTQALGVGSSLVGLGTAVAGSGGSIFGDTTGGARTAKHGGRIRPRKFAYGGDTSNFDDETNYAGYGSEPSRDSFDERFSGETGGGSSRDDSSSASSQSDDDKKDDGDILDKFMKVGEKPPQIKPPASITGAFPKIKSAASRNPYISPTLRGYGATANIPQSGAPQSSSGSSTGSTIGKTIGGIGGTLIGGPVGGMIGSAAGSLFGGMFGKDGGRVGRRYYEEGDTIDAARTPVTGNPEDERLFRERMSLPPSRATFVQEARPSIPTPDPLAPYLGTEGPRSVTGPPRGSPAGNEFRAGNPVQARDASPLQLTRERLQRELEDNPRLARTFDANTTAEVGTGPGARRGYQAATIDRAVQTGQPLGNIVNNPNYYPWSTRAATRTTGQGVDDSLWAGANPVNYGTGNASRDPRTGRDVGFAGGPQTASIGRERYGIEGQSGLPYARAVGYTGPDVTPIGFRPGAPVGSQGTPLEGGPTNAAGDLEVSAQKRMPPRPGQDPNAPNFGYGPATTQQVPGMAPPPRDFAQRWAVNPFTQAGIAMLRSQSPYFATGLGEGLAGAAGVIEHTREQQVLDSRPKLLTDFPTLMYQKGDGTFVDTHVPNPKYEANKLARDKFDYEQKIAKGQKWKPTGMIENGRIILYNEQTGQTKLGQRVDDQDKPIPATTAPATTSTQPEKTTAAWAPNLNANPDDPAVKELVPDEGPISKKTVEDRAKANIKTLDKAREQHEAANQQIGRMNQMETALSALPKEGFLSPGYLAGYNATIASAINHAARMVGAGDQFSPEQVAAMEEANKIKTLGGFLQSRLTGGGQHNAAAIIQASMRAYPGAENSPQGAALIIAANREVAQRDRDYYEFITKHGNTTFRGNLNAATLYFDRVAPMEKYIERARAKVEAKFPPTAGGATTTQQPQRIDESRQRALDWLQKNPNDPDAPAVRQRLGIQ